jgi:hypothetical protein
VTVLAAQVIPGEEEGQDDGEAGPDDSGAQGGAAATSLVPEAALREARKRLRTMLASGSAQRGIGVGGGAGTGGGEGAPALSAGDQGGCGAGQGLTAFPRGMWRQGSLTGGSSSVGGSGGVAAAAPGSLRAVRVGSDGVTPLPQLPNAGRAGSGGGAALAALGGCGQGPRSGPPCAFATVGYPRERAIHSAARPTTASMFAVFGKDLAGSGKAQQQLPGASNATVSGATGGGKSWLGPKFCCWRHLLVEVEQQVFALPCHGSKVLNHPPAASSIIAG